jgi:Peptidase family M23
METLGRILFATYIIFLLLAAIMIAGSIGALTGESHMIISGLIVLLLWLLLAGMTIRAITYAAGMSGGRSDKIDDGLWWAKVTFLYFAILSAVTGLGLAFLALVGCGPLWVPSLYHWGGLVGTVLGFLAVFLLPVIVHKTLDETSDRATAYGWPWVVFVPLGVALLFGLIWLIPYLLLKGDIKESDYKAADHVYKLPFPGGETTWVIQGNNSSFNHKNGQANSWDFRRRCGTPVLAARDGTILKVTDGNDGVGGDNNEIQVSQGSGADATVAHYMHIQKSSVPAKFRTVGAAVKQGDEIARVGSVGNSLTGHIHFMVKKGNSTVPVSFTDVTDDKGIPRTFHSYTSGNRRVP